MSRGARLLPNIGAEESDDWRVLHREPAVVTTLQLWRWLFGAQAQLVHCDLPAPRWPSELGPCPTEPVFAWLENSGGFVPWLLTPEAATRCADQAGELAGPSPEQVMRVHDKAFAHEVVRREGLLPVDMEGQIVVLEPELLREPDQAVQRICETLADWPAQRGKRFTLKPRFGTSGRGRVAGRGDPVNVASLRAALPRLAARGGALLEPWLERDVDLSAQLRIGAQGEILLLGTLELIVSASGLYLGHRGAIDSRGRVSSDSPHEAALREAAVAMAAAARSEGFFGACGTDAFAYWTKAGTERGDEGARSVLRPLVEFNARFTLGTVVIGLLRRALDLLRRELGLEPGTRRFFYFGLDSPPEGWESALARAGSDARLINLSEEGAASRAALLFATRTSDLDHVVAAARGGASRAA